MINDLSLFTDDGGLTLLDRLNSHNIKVDLTSVEACLIFVAYHLCGLLKMKDCIIEAEKEFGVYS